MPADLVRMYEAFDGAKLFIDGIHLIQFLGISGSGESLDSDLGIRAYTQHWREKSGRANDWAIAMTNYGSLILLGRDSTVREWDQSDGWIGEVCDFPKWITKIFKEGDEYLAEASADAAETGSVRDLASEPTESNVGDIDKLLAGFSSVLEPLRDAVKRYLVYPSLIDSGGVALVGHRPWVAPLNYMFRIYPPTSEAQRDHYCNTRNLTIPRTYSDFLGQLNGAFCFGISLCGLTGVSADGLILLDRATVQCYDLSLAVSRWVRGYRQPPSPFLFGYRAISYHENAGYFMDADGTIFSAVKRGDILNKWLDFRSFLEEELAASEALEEELHPKK